MLEGEIPLSLRLNDRISDKYGKSNLLSLGGYYLRKFTLGVVIKVCVNWGFKEIWQCVSFGIAFLEVC